MEDWMNGQVVSLTKGCLEDKGFHVHTMKIYGTVQLQIHSFSPLAVDADEAGISCSA